MGTFMTILTWVILIVVTIVSVVLTISMGYVIGGAMLYMESKDINIDDFDSGYWANQFRKKLQNK